MEHSQNKDCLVLNALFAAELFSKLTTEQKKQIIAQIKALLSRE